MDIHLRKLGKDYTERGNIGTSLKYYASLLYTFGKQSRLMMLMVLLSYPIDMSYLP